MNSSNRRQIIVVVLIAFVFFSPIALFTCDYKSKTTLPGKTSFTESTDGQVMKAGISSIFPKSDQLQKAGISIKRINSMHFGIYSSIDMTIAYEKVIAGKPIAFDISISYNFYGLGSSSIKRDFANDLAVGLIEAQASKINKESSAPLPL